MNINSSNVQFSDVTIVSNTSLKNINSLFLQKIKGASQSILDLNPPNSFHETDYGAQDRAYKAYAREKRDNTEVIQTNEIGDYVKFSNPAKSEECYDASRRLSSWPLAQQPAYSVARKNDLSIVSSLFCKYIFSLAKTTTRMCNWWAISGPAQGAISGCRPTTPTVESTTKV